MIQSIYAKSSGTGAYIYSCDFRARRGTCVSLWWCCRTSFAVLQQCDLRKRGTPDWRTVHLDTGWNTDIFIWRTDPLWAVALGSRERPLLLYRFHSSCHCLAWNRNHNARDIKVSCFHFASGTSSARAFASIPVCSKTAAIFSFSTIELKLLASIFLFCAKPACITRKKSSSVISSKNAFEILLIARIAESTEGGGEKCVRETFAIIFGVPYALTESDRILSFSLVMRCATSFCIRSAIARGCFSAVRNCRMISPVM